MGSGVGRGEAGDESKQGDAAKAAQKKHACPCKASHAIKVADGKGTAAGACGVGVLGRSVGTEHGGVQSRES